MGGVTIRSRGRTVGAVIGYDGLRVVDASIFPDLPRANTNLPTVMVAERIAQWLRAAR
jgi:5-(hydroxymethyl)furfural/furfural oxidase